jgi:hypothetical protein
VGCRVAHELHAKGPSYRNSRDAAASETELVGGRLALVAERAGFILRSNSVDGAASVRM